MGQNKLWRHACVLMVNYACGSDPTADLLSEPYLGYALESPLKKAECAEDSDGDCLDDSVELELALAAAPMMFFDEDERCGDLTEYRVRPFFQVRPIETKGTVEDWEPGCSDEKRVNVTYFFNWPIDCGYSTEKSHLGDSEHITFQLESSDLVHWSIHQAIYRSHGDEYPIDGAHLDDLADAIGADRATVAVEGDKHGSWWGFGADSNDCAGSETNFGLGAIDCFPGMTWGDAFDAGEYSMLELSHELNIGEPPLGEGRFLEPAVVAVIDGEGVERFRTASQYDDSANHLNQLGGTEYWWNAPSDHPRFCGWVCPEADRSVEGCSQRTFQIGNGEWKDFDSTLDSNTAAECAGSLEEKIDRTPTRFLREVAR